MGTFCSCCYIGKTSSMIENIRETRRRLEWEENVVDTEYLPEPMKKKFTFGKKKKKYYDMNRDKVIALYKINEYRRSA